MSSGTDREREERDGVQAPPDVDDPMLTLKADLLEAERLSRMRQARILRFQIQWMETLAEHARRQLSGLDAASGATLPAAEHLERAAQAQADVTGEVPRASSRGAPAREGAADGGHARAADSDRSDG